MQHDVALASGIVEVWTGSQRARGQTTVAKSVLLRAKSKYKYKQPSLPPATSILDLDNVHKEDDETIESGRVVTVTVVPTLAALELAVQTLAAGSAQLVVIEMNPAEQPTAARSVTDAGPRASMSQRISSTVQRRFHSLKGTTKLHPSAGSTFEVVLCCK
jgi:predicted hotdog family 3-hydroxylacyl-ACP dehydratase